MVTRSSDDHPLPPRRIPRLGCRGCRAPAAGGRGRLLRPAV